MITVIQSRLNSSIKLSAKTHCNYLYLTSCYMVRRWHQTHIWISICREDIRPIISIILHIYDKSYSPHNAATSPFCSSDSCKAVPLYKYLTLCHSAPKPEAGGDTSVWWKTQKTTESQDVTNGCCCPSCTLGNNLHTFIVWAGKFSQPPPYAQEGPLAVTVFHFK